MKPEINPHYQEIEPDEAAAKLDAGELLAIDVRQVYEWATGHIEGAYLLPIESLSGFAQALARLNLAKNTPILFVCAVGQRSATACRIAAGAGFTEVYNLRGGMGNWAYYGLPIVKS